MTPLGMFLIVIGAIALAGIIAGSVLGASGYSSAGPFAIASACVGVLGTLAAEKYREDHPKPPEGES